MTETMTALQAFFSGFGLTAYPEDSVPADSKLPYITYMPVRPHGLDAATMQARWRWGATTAIFSNRDMI